MGDPKRQRKKYETPTHPWQKDRLIEELRLVGQYGLRNKRELWRFKTMLSEIRARARQLLAVSPEERQAQEKALIRRLYEMGILDENATLDDVLSLTVEDLLKRRLQTVVYELGIARTIHQARQMIVHRHITVNGRVVTSPSYIVKRSDVVALHPRSPFNKILKETQATLASPEASKGEE
ncbi:MAG: 30S ribosomal protein S4 [Candidatus Njordarchaeales archaeon]